jgi:lipoprotein-anchoring transpeptidase ErfK/SrfK
VRGPIVACAVVAALTASASSGARPAPLYWTSAPPPGTHILLGGSGSSTLRVAAAAGDPRARVTLSLLGKTPVRLETRRANPAAGILRFPAPRDFGERTFVVTIVARTSGAHRLAISRTVIVSVRPTTVSLVGPGSISRWAYVLHAATAHATPSVSSRVTGSVPATTSDAMPNLVRVLQQMRTPTGALWVHVVLTSLPNSRTGWVPRDDLSVFHSVATRVVVDTRRLTLTLFRSGRRILRTPVGVGMNRWPTPRGAFYIRERLTNFHDAFYGPIAFGTSARSTTLTDWPGGGIVGIHGTNRPDLIPGRISHGCIRLRNADILRLARLLPLGTPVEIR